MTADGGISVQVKWQKEVFDVTIDTTQPPAVFKAQMFALTGVQPDRQKIMVKGGMLKDDADWAPLGIKPGQKLMMMGSRDEAPQAPKNAPVFVEDLPEEEQDVTGMAKYGAGLENLGNTCYMNSTMQYLYAVPELRNALRTYPSSPPGSAPAGPARLAHRLTIAIKNLFASMEKSAMPVTPYPFLTLLREKYPQFAEQEAGIYKQQDAEECYTQIVWTLRECLHLDPSTEPMMKQLFGVGLHTELRCEESGEVITEDSTVFTLKCNISIDVNYLHQGLALGLKEDREKRSDLLGRDVLFAGDSKIASLPPHLSLQLVRFFYKVEAQQKAKILRKVAFPFVLDMYDFCTPDLQASLAGPREAFKLAEDAKAGALKKQKTAEPEATSSGAADVDMPDATPTDADVLALHQGRQTGRYDLQAVLTHKGRSADSGHYVAWVKQADGTWIQFDDDQLIVRKAEEVQTLAGGGDWHMAYMLLYRAQTVPGAAPQEESMAGVVNGGSA